MMSLGPFRWLVPVAGWPAAAANSYCQHGRCSKYYEQKQKLCRKLSGPYLATVTEPKEHCLHPVCLGAPSISGIYLVMVAEPKEQLFCPNHLVSPSISSGVISVLLLARVLHCLVFQGKRSSSAPSARSDSCAATILTSTPADTRTLTPL